MMRAVTLAPGQPGSLELRDVADPPPSDGSVLVSTMSIGVCGTDLEMIAGEYGAAPAGEARLVLGHESLGRVLDAPADAGVNAGDRVVGIVRRPDPEPCINCAKGEADMCRNGRYTERGIKGLHGFASQRYRADPEYLVRVDDALHEVGVLVEPASVVAKAWDHIDRIGGRAAWSPQTALVTGAGPVGLLATLLSVQRGLEVHVIDRVPDGLKPELVRSVGATYHTSTREAIPPPNVVLECTGAGQVILDVIGNTAAGAVVCLLGVSAPGRKLAVDAGALNRQVVLENDVVFGSVSANRLHYEAGAAALLAADQEWVRRLVTRRVSLREWADAYVRHGTDIKTVLDFP